MRDATSCIQIELQTNQQNLKYYQVTDQNLIFSGAADLFTPYNCSFSPEQNAQLKSLGWDLVWKDSWCDFVQVFSLCLIESLVEAVRSVNQTKPGSVVCFFIFLSLTSDHFCWLEVWYLQSFSCKCFGRLSAFIFLFISFNRKPSDM